MNRLKQLQKAEQTKTKYDFKDLISRHTQGQTSSIYIEKELVPPGDYISVEKYEELDIAAMVSITNEDLKADLGGLFNHDTRKLYCYKLLNKGDKIVNIMNNGTKRRYTILYHEDKSDYDDGLHIYYLERSDLNDRRED